MISRWWILALALLTTAAVPPALAQEKQKIAVLSIRAAEGLNKDTAKLLDELLLTEIQEAGDFEVLGSADIVSMMTLEEERVKITGCADDSCLVEIGGALGVNLLVASSVGAVGDRFLLNVKILDVSTAKVLKRTSEALDDDQAKLIDAIKRAAAKVIEGIKETQDSRPAKSESGRDGATTDLMATPTVQSEQEKPVGFLSVAPWLTLGLAVAAGAAGGTLVGLGASDESKQEDEFFGTPEWRDIRDSGETKYTAGGVLLGVAGVAAIGTLILFLVDGEEGSASAVMLPTPGGASVAALYRW